MTEEDPAEGEPYRRDSDFLDAHLEELAVRYPNQWVAVFNGEVAAVAADLQGLVDQLRTRGVPENRAVVADLAPPGSQGDWRPASKEVQEELERFRRDSDYLQAHYEELLDRYPERWVAVFNERVVGVAPELDELLDGLMAEGLPIGRVYVQFLTREEVDWILPVVAS
jgi:hypothetical protein